LDKKENDDDEFLEKFQQQQRKREQLETKSKISHRVFCPYYPEVIARKIKTLFSYFSLRSNKNVGGYMLPIKKIIH
jgi:hypothetical protein